MSLYSTNQNISSNPLSIDGLITNDYDILTVNGVGLVPYTGASQAVDLNNKAVSNVASLAVNGAVSGASVTASGAISGNSLAITNNTATGSLTSIPTTYPVANIKIDTSTTIFVVMIPYPASFIVGATVQIYNFNTLPAFNRTYVITSVVLGSSLFYANYTSGLTVGDRYYTSTARAYVSNGVGSVSCMNLSSQISASLANLTCTGTNAISNLTTTGTLATSGITVAGTSFLEFGFGTSGKNANAGKIAYELFEAGFLGIVGAGNSVGTRNVKIYDNATIAGTLNVSGVSTVPTPATSDNSTQIATTAFVNNFAIPISGICTGVNTTLRLFNALTTAVFRITSPSGTNIFQVYYTSGVPEVICSSLQVANTGEFRAYGNCNLGTTNVGSTLTVGNNDVATSIQTFYAGVGTVSAYTTPTTIFYGPRAFDAGNIIAFQCNASQYGRNQLWLVGRFESSNDAWSFTGARNCIRFRTQSSLNSAYTDRFTIQNFNDKLGIMCAGLGDTPVSIWDNVGNLYQSGAIISTGTTNPANGTIGVWLRYEGGAGTLTAGTYGTNFLPMSLNNSTCTFNSNGVAKMFYNSTGVGIGHATALCTMDFKGTANIWTGTRYAVINNHMSAGSLTIGSITSDYGSGTGWNSNTAGLLMECLDNTEIAVHNSGNSVNSIVQYVGGLQRLRFGRDMGSGWGETPSLFDGTIYCVANTALSTRSTYGQLVVSNGFNNNSIIHRHDGTSYYMLISNGVYDTVWNSLRPFYIEIASGVLNSNNSQYFRGGCIVERNTRTGSHGNSALYVTAETSSQSESIIECRHGNGTQGIGLGWNSINAIGSASNQDIFIIPKGNGIIKNPNGDNSVCLYGPNGSWNSYLYVGASTNRITTSSDVAQVISTNANIHIDAGFNRDMYLNYYTINAGSNSAIRMYGTTIQLPNLPNQSAYTANVVQYGSSGNLHYAQLQSFRFVTTGAWGGGVGLGDFNKASQQSCVVIRGDGSYYVSGAGNTAIVCRLYNNNTGGTYYYYYYQFTNVTSNHCSYAFNHLALNNDLPIGNYSVYMYLAGGSYITDGNDYISLTVTVQP